MATVRLSKKFTLAGSDLLRGLLMAVLTPVLVVVQQSIEKGSLVFNWQQLAMAAVGGGVAYLLKNFFIEPAKVITTTTNTKAENAATNIKEVV
ncbi:hypothetical protein [Mucilaginibacter sp.]|jgi:hypothetical protein|uniref:hypothetical protein n=1 Tax=Mucilaginibacter sp. TaxID=1882438 RepID=UPI003567F096